MKSLPAILLASTLCVACTTPPALTKSVIPDPIVHNVYVRDATVIHDDVELGGAAIRMPENRDYLYDAHYIGDAKPDEHVTAVDIRQPDDKSIYAKAKDQSIYAKDHSRAGTKKATAKTSQQKKATKKSKKATGSAKTVTSVSGVKVAPTITAVKDEF